MLKRLLLLSLDRVFGSYINKRQITFCLTCISFSAEICYTARKEEKEGV